MQLLNLVISLSYYSIDNFHLNVLSQGILFLLGQQQGQQVITESCNNLN